MRGGVLAVGAVGPAHGENDGAPLHPLDELRKGFPDKVADRHDGGFLKPHTDFLKVVSDEGRVIIQHAHQGGPGNTVGDLETASQRGKDDLVGSGLTEFFLRGGILRARDDSECRIHVAGRQGDEDIHHVVGKHGGQGTGAVDAGLGRR